MKHKLHKWGSVRIIGIESKESKDSKLDNIFIRIEDDKYEVTKACMKIANYLSTRFTPEDFYDNKKFANGIQDIPTGCIPVTLDQLVSAFKEVSENIEVVSNSKNPQKLLQPVMDKLKREMHKYGLEIFGYNEILTKDLTFTSGQIKYYLIRLLKEYECVDKYGSISIRNDYVKDSVDNVVKIKQIEDGQVVKMNLLYAKTKDGFDLMSIIFTDENDNCELTPLVVYASLKDYKEIKRYNEELIKENLENVREMLSKASESARLAILSNLSIEVLSLLGY